MWVVPFEFVGTREIVNQLRVGYTENANAKQSNQAHDVFETEHNTKVNKQL